MQGPHGETSDHGQQNPSAGPPPSLFPGLDSARAPAEHLTPDALDETVSMPGGGAVKAIFVLLLVGLFVFVGWKMLGPDEAMGNWYHDMDDGWYASEETGKPILVLYTADWCPPCQYMKKSVFTDGAVEEYMRDEFICVKIDLTEQASENQRIASEFDVRSIPTIHIFDQDGRQIDHLLGVLEAPEFLRWLERIRSRA